MGLFINYVGQLGEGGGIVPGITQGHKGQGMEGLWRGIGFLKILNLNSKNCVQVSLKVYLCHQFLQYFYNLFF